MAESAYGIGQAGREDGTHRAVWSLYEMGVLAGGIAGIGAFLLAILGLFGLSPQVLVCAAVICAGAALLSEGGVIAAGLSRGMAGVAPDHEDMQMAGGLGLQALAGLVTVIIGVMALLGYNPETLLCSSAIVAGAGLLATGVSLIQWTPASGRNGRGDGDGRERAFFRSGGGAELSAGIGSGILGVMGLVLGSPVTFTLVAMLVAGAGLFFSGTAISAKVFRAPP